jgi:hypothetical protein
MPGARADRSAPPKRKSGIFNSAFTFGTRAMTAVGRRLGKRAMHDRNRHMKGLIISAVLFAAFVAFTALISHALKPRRYVIAFVYIFLLWSPLYFLCYMLTPRDLGFLKPSLLCSVAWVDMLYGYILFVLNFHSYIDFLGAFNGGFSTSLLVEVLRAGPEGCATQHLVAKYRRPGEGDAIYGWRIPLLAKGGWITVDTSSGIGRLTMKGTVVAHVAQLAKRLLNLGKGG